MTLTRPTITLPPPGWRKPIPGRVKLDVVIRQEGRCAATGEKLGGIREIDYDHRPPLSERPYDPEIDDTIPTANDPAYIFAIRKEPHKQQTKADATRRAKTRRLRKAKSETDDSIWSRPCGQKRIPKGNIKSRNTLRKRESDV